MRASCHKTEPPHHYVYIKGNEACFSREDQDVGQSNNKKNKTDVHMNTYSMIGDADKMPGQKTQEEGSINSKGAGNGGNMNHKKI